MSSLNIHYHWFWDGLGTDDKVTPKFFNYLFENIEYAQNKEIHIYSVFNTRNEKVMEKDPNKLLVLYSGEPKHYQSPYNVDSYDISLIMEDSDEKKGIVKLTFFSLISYNDNNWPIYMKLREYKPKSKFCCQVVSNPACEMRNKMFLMLNEVKRADSWGRAYNNCGELLRPSFGSKEFLEFLNPYKFMLCFENSSSPNYLTEKLANAWLGNTIPVYWGAANAVKWLNPKAFLYLEDTSDQAINNLIDKIIELDNDHDKYMEMFNHPLFINNEIPHDLDIKTVIQKVNNILSVT
jgi:hypothetical protein